MTSSSSTQEYTDRLIDAILDCLTQCAASEDTATCARDYVACLRNDPTWLACDTDRVERAILRSVELAESGSFKMWP